MSRAALKIQKRDVEAAVATAVASNLCSRVQEKTQLI